LLALPLPLRLLPALVALAILTLGASGCRNGGKRTLSPEQRRRAGEAVVNLAAEPTTLDPARATRLAGLRVLGQCLEGLTRIGPDGLPRPALAESWEVAPDGRTYRFHLRRAFWSNGDPVRSSDFVYAWRRVLDPETRAYWTDLFFAIEGARDFYGASPAARGKIALGIETPDERTLVVKLEKPLPYFLSLAALEPYFPLHRASVERLGAAAFEPGGFVADGPFRLVEHVPRRRIVFEPNPYYYDRARVGLKRLVFVMVENEFTEWTAYRRGEIDITAGVHRGVPASLRSAPDYRTVPLVGTCYLAFNCRRSPFDRVGARRAFALAIDRRRLVERITRSGEAPATGFVPPGIPAGAAGGDFRKEGGELIAPGGPGEEGAGRLRALVGALRGQVSYSFDADELNRSIAVALQMMWRQTLGVEVEIRSFPSRLLSRNKRRGDFMIARASWIADYLDPTTFLDLFRSDSRNNVTGWADPRYDALLDEAAATTDSSRRAALLHRAERMLVEQMPVCPLYFYSIAYLQRPGLEGVERNPLGRLFFRYARWVGRAGGRR